MKGKKLKKAFSEWSDVAESKFDIVGDPLEEHSLIFIIDGDENFHQIGYDPESKSLFFNTYLQGELKTFKDSKNPEVLDKWLYEINKQIK